MNKLYDQVEGLLVANEWRLKILREQFFGELGKFAPEHVLNSVTPDIVETDVNWFGFYEVHYEFWSDKMCDIYGQVRALQSMQDQLGTILSTNKTSLLDGNPDQQ